MFYLTYAFIDTMIDLLIYGIINVRSDQGAVGRVS
jgi:hypothetical protein